MTVVARVHASSGTFAALRALLLARADLETAGGMELTVGDTGELPFVVPSPYRLVIHPATLARSDAASLIRHGLELAWMRAVAPDRPALCGILAARVAALHRAIEPGRTDSAADRGLLEAAPQPATLARVWPRLAAYQGINCALSSTDIATAAAAWSLAAPSEYLMASANDPRLAIDAATGLNHYGCRPRPQPDVVTFSSCTASSISERGYSSAESIRRRLLAAALLDSDRRCAETAWLGAELLQHFGVADIADAVLAPSGTDATAMITGMIRAERPDTPLSAIIMGRSETGNAIPGAVTCGPSACPQAGLATVALREDDGLLRSMDDVQAEIASAVSRAAAGGHAILHPVDVSKTGILAPQEEFLTGLANMHRGHLHIVIDGCQARVGGRQLRRYLSDGHSVVITGSKFYTGPPFSGAVLFPRRQFSAGHRPDTGTMLRWGAALGEMRAFAAVPPEERVENLRRFGSRILRRVAENPRLVPFPTPVPRRMAGEGWDEQQTIFVFGVRDPRVTDRLLDFETLAAIQRGLYSDLSQELPGRVAGRVCRLGQPVRLGENPTRPLAALRIAAGARLVSGEPSHVLRRGESHIDREIADLDDVMAKLDLILDHLPQVMRAKCARALSPA